jgi:Tol biopolymer transport system component
MRRNQRIAAGIVGIAVFVAAIWLVTSVSFLDRSSVVPGGDTTGPTSTDGEVSNVPPPEGIFSEVGGWIAFEDGGALRAVAPDGSEETVLLDDEQGAQDWSPDGSRLLVDRPGGLAVIEPDGSETTLARFDVDTWFTSASFSPDGSTVVYATGPTSGDGPFRMWTIASDGSGEPRLILESGRRECGDGLCFQMLYGPTFSPDGRQIAYGEGFGDSTHALKVVNADGTDVRVLFDARPPFDEAGHLWGVEWSPDGSLIAVASAHYGIYTIHPDGTDFRLLIPGSGAPEWSPDGSQIAYSFRGGVWVANADGSDPRMLSLPGMASSHLHWNPGGPADQT